MSDYQAEKIELEAQAYWQQQNSFAADDNSSKSKFYCLSMMPYPSGDLHMGHVRNYTIGDVISRYQRMCGHEVMQPMCWDAFGLPAENAAIKHKVTPHAWTEQNVANMKQQMQRFGLSYDWQREFATCDAEYYRWNQWLFLQMHKQGLAYRKESTVNWDPVDQTVLANEQVIDGKGWRSGAPIERRKIPQWFLKITDYADQLLDDLDQLTEWPERVKTMQRNWIGRSHGVNIRFAVAEREEKIEVYTTRVDTQFGVGFIAVAPQHPLALAAAEAKPDIAKFVDECSHLKTAEADLALLDKKGIDTGFKAINPVNDQAVPIWVANYVLMDYGTGAVMGVPAHDERDHEFALKYQLPIQPVLQPESEHDFRQSAFIGGASLVNSEQFDGLSKDAGIRAIGEFLMEKGAAEFVTKYRLRDWGVSRQRYWGTPIPMIYCEDCDAVPVPEEQLPVILPTDIEFDGTQSPLGNMADFLNVDCPNCGKPARRETDTFDTFIDSSWYYARLTCPDQHETMLASQADGWLPVNQYIGGIEHAILHLLYARFIHKVMRDIGLVSCDEPFKRLLSQGMVLKDGHKMSKSKGNIVAPMPLIEKYGADTLRLFMIFTAPPEQSLEWNDSAVEGAQRFLKRLWHHCQQYQTILAAQSPVEDSNEAQQARQQLHSHLQQANYDIERQQFNTVISATMKILNLLTEIDVNNLPGVSSEGIHILLRLLAPVTPHICHTLWQELGFSDQIILDQPWPQADKNALQTDQLTLVVQVNGKRRAEVAVARDADQSNIEATVLAHPQIERHLEGQAPRKIILVPGKLVNVVS